MKKLTTWIPLAIFAAFGIVQAADQYRPNPYTGKLDNIGTYANVSAQYRSKFTQISASAAKGGVNFTSLSSYYKKAAHSQYSAHTQNQLNNKVGLAKFTNNSTYTAAHIRSVSPYGNHPAAGSNRQLQYNNAGAPAGAAYLTYSSPYTTVASGGRLGVNTSKPQAPLHVHFSTADPGASLYGTSTGLTGSTQDNSFQADLVVADGTNQPGFSGVIHGVRARGSLAVPAVPLLDDLVFKFNGGVWDSGKVFNAAEISLKVDGAVSTNTAPMRIVFNTRTNGAGPFVEKMVIKSTGLTYFSGGGGLPYGQMYSNTSTTIPVAASGTWYEVDTGATDFTAGRLKNVTQTDHYLVAPTAGDYLINAAASFGTTAAGDEIALSVMINGVASATCHGHATVVTATTTVPSSCVTILTLAANDQVSLAVQNHSAARNITLSHSQLSILHVGSP